jgi:hypothetical protein
MMFTFIQKCGATSERQPKTSVTFSWTSRSHPTYVLKISNSDLKNSMITYLTFQDLSINVWQKIKFSRHSRNVSLLGRRNTLTEMHVRTLTTSMI